MRAEKLYQLRNEKVNWNRLEVASPVRVEASRWNPGQIRVRPQSQIFDEALGSRRVLGLALCWPRAGTLSEGAL